MFSGIPGQIQACGGETLPEACYTFLPVGATSVPFEKKGQM